jgi:hypothetical protein
VGRRLPNCVLKATPSNKSDDLNLKNTVKNTVTLMWLLHFASQSRLHAISLRQMLLAVTAQVQQ